MENVIFGWSLVIDLVDCNSNISDADALKRYASELCGVIDMIPYGEPQTPYFGEKSEVTKGYSLVQLIETSAIMGHFSDYYKSAHIDIFSCKEYDWELALEFTEVFFGGTRSRVEYLTRYAKQ